MRPIGTVKDIQQLLVGDGLQLADAWPFGADEQDTLRGSCILLLIRPAKVLYLHCLICSCKRVCMFLFVICYKQVAG